MREPTPEEKQAFHRRILELNQILACRREAHATRNKTYQRRCAKALKDFCKRNNLGGPHP